MAQLVIPPGFGHITFSLTNSLNGKVCNITDGFKIAATPYTQTQAELFASDLATALKPLYDSSWTLGPVSFLVGNDGPKFRFDSTATAAGTRSAQTNPPPNVTLLIKKTTGFAGRKFRGRAYWPYGGGTATIDEAGHIVGGEATVVNTQVAAWRAAFTSTPNNTAGQYLLHAGSDLPTAVIAFARENIVATQRRRLVRIGA